MQRKRKARCPDPNSPDLMTLLKLVENEISASKLELHGSAAADIVGGQSVGRAEPEKCKRCRKRSIKCARCHRLTNRTRPTIGRNTQRERETEIDIEDILV